MRELAESLLALAASEWGVAALIAHGYLESFILPVAHDLFLVTVALAEPHLSFIYSAISTLSSVLGLATGYAIGLWGGQFVLVRLVGPRMVIFAKRKIHRYDSWAIALACFTPVPVRVFAVVAGAVKLNFKKYIFIGMAARGLRFFLIGALIFFFGETIREWILEYMTWVMLGIFALLIIAGLIWHFVKTKVVEREAVGEPDPVQK